MSDSIVNAGWIAAHRGERGVRLVEVDVSRTAYDERHIPGAALWNAYGDLRDAAYQPIDRDAFASLIARSGIEPGSTIVVYGYGAALGYWLLRANGFDQVRILDGSRDSWVQAGEHWTTEAPPPPATRRPLPAEDTALIATRGDVLGALDDPGVLLVDVRSQLEYAGERFWPSGAAESGGRAGHIPGAVSLPVELLRTGSGALREPEALERAFTAAGVTKDRAIITYCTIGNRASHAWLALTDVLGYPNVRVYYGSWVDWGKRPDTPIEA